MKKLFLAFFIFISLSAIAQDDLVLIADSDAGNTKWIGVSSTFTHHNDGYSIMIIKREKNKADARMYTGVMAAHCSQGFGSLKARDTLEDKWDTIAQFNLKVNQSVADGIANVLCAVGAGTKDKKGSASL